MNRQNKEQVVQSLQSDLKTSQASFLVGYKGMTVAQLTDLRRKLHGFGSLQVAKVTLMERAIDQVPSVDGLQSYLGDQIALVFAHKESPAVAKILFTFAKGNEQLKLIAGCFEHTVLAPDRIKVLASLPTREILLAPVCGTLKAPTHKLVMMLNLMLVRLCIVLQQAAEKKKAA